MGKGFSENFFFYGFFTASLLLVSAAWLWAWSALRQIEGPLIIHFSEYTGINQIGGLADIHGLGATGIVIVVLNFALALTLWPKEVRRAKLLAVAALFIAVLLFTALAAIISVNQ